MSSDPFAKLVERQEWLENIEVPLQDALQAGFRSLGDAEQPVRDALHGTWLHEPLHAVLTDVPIGAWTAAVAFDSLAMLGCGSQLDTAADASITVGLAGAVGAAVTGLNDWSGLEGAPRRIGAAHALLNIAAVGFFLSSCISRSRGSRSAGRATAMLGYLVVSASAHLGGNLVYEHGVGVQES